MKMEEKKEKTPLVWSIIKYSLLGISLYLYFGCGFYSAALSVFGAYMWFTDWAWTRIFE